MRDQTPILNPNDPSLVSQQQLRLALEARSRRREPLPRHNPTSHWCTTPRPWTLASDVMHLKTIDAGIRSYFLKMREFYQNICLKVKSHITAKFKGLYAFVYSMRKQLKPLMLELFPGGDMSSPLVESLGNCHLWGLYWSIQEWITNNPTVMDGIQLDAPLPREMLPSRYEDLVRRRIMSREDAWDQYRRETQPGPSQAGYIPPARNMPPPDSVDRRLSQVL